MVIGIGGVSRSGKTTLAKHLHNTVLPNAYLLHQDDYTHTVEKIPLWNNQTDWEHPDSINELNFVKAIEVAKKEFDHVIVDGFLIYHFASIRKLCDVKILIEINKDQFVARKLEDRRWGKVSQEYIEHIWNSYLKYGVIDKDLTDLIMCGDDNILTYDFNKLFEETNK